jgi:hypothetical protein
MATITGNWSGSTSALNTLQNLNVEQSVLNAAALYNGLETAFWNGSYTVNSASDSFISVTTFSGYSLSFGGSGFTTNSITLNTVNVSGFGDSLNLTRIIHGGAHKVTANVD